MYQKLIYSLFITFFIFACAKEEPELNIPEEKDNSFKIYNHRYSGINLDNDKDFQKILENLKITYEDYWKKNNEINTSIKLPLTVSINSQSHKKIKKLEELFDNSDLISDFYVLKFDSETIQYKVVYNGSPKSFLNSMNKNNFDLDIKNKTWIIR